MYSHRFDFAEFLSKVVDLGYTELVSATEREIDNAKNQVRGRTPRAKRAREWGALEYVGELEKFLSFVAWSTKASNVKDANFRLYKPIVENLVNKGQFKPTVLTWFSEN